MLVGTLFLALSFLLVLSQASICALHIYTISTQPKDCGESSANCWGFLSLPISDLQILATLASTNSELSSQLLDITDSIWVAPPHAEDWNFQAGSTSTAHLVYFISVRDYSPALSIVQYLKTVVSCVLSVFFFLACLGHEDKSGPYICIMALPSLRPYVINHLQQNCFAVQKLLQAKGIGSAQALRQKKVWHNMCFRNSSEIMGQMQIEWETGKEFEKTDFCFVYLLPTAAITIHHKFGDFKQHKLILQLRRLKFQNASYWA